MQTTVTKDQLNTNLQAIFSRFYPYQCTLIDYLSDVKERLHYTDDQTDYIHLLNHTIVCYHDKQINPQCFTSNVKKGMRMREVIQRVIEMTCLSALGSSGNVLSLGYQRVRNQNNSTTSTSIVNKFPNSAGRLLTSKYWQVLHECIGDDLMIHLLKDVSLFVLVKNDCYLQVSGVPMHNIPEIQHPLDDTVVNQLSQHTVVSLESVATPQLPEHMTLQQSSDLENMVTQPIPEQTILPEPSNLENMAMLPEHTATDLEQQQSPQNTAMQICSEGDSQSCETGISAVEVMKGKRKNTGQLKEPLSKRPRYLEKQKSVRTAGTNNKLKANTFALNSNTSNVYFPVHSLLYSNNFSDKFPKKHILSSTNVSKRGAASLIEKIFIESKSIPENNRNTKKRFERKEIQVTKAKLIKNVRLPKRFVKMKVLFEKLLRRHKRCRFSALLKHHCKVMAEEEEDNESSNATKLQKQYEHAARNFTQSYQVVLFVKAVCNKVIPKELWGTTQNKKVFYRNLDKFIKLNQGEKFTLGQMVNGVKVSSCGWLKYETKRKEVPLSESQKQQEVLYKWLWWLVRCYIMVVLKTFFYITENASQTKEIFFYRKPVWRVIHRYGLTTMENDLIKPLTKEETTVMLNSSSFLGYSSMRFLPKELTIRPIINMKHQPLGSTEIKVQSSINSRLRNVFEIVKFEKARNPQKLGSAVFGIDDVYQAMNAFSSKRQENSDDRSVHMVHVDISKCFDTIVLDKLYDIMKTVFTEEEYLVRRYVMIKYSNDTVRKGFRKSVDVGEDCRTFIEFLGDFIQEKELTNLVFVDQVYYTYEENDNILALLKQHLFENMVKVGNKFYRQIKGIAQGSILSSYLCSYFYSHMERRYLKRMLNDESSLLMRWVDDFLFLTPSQQLADTFLQLMNAGVSRYGCQISAKKTLVNYATPGKDGLPVRCIAQDKAFPWCGFRIHPKTLDTQVDFSRYEGKNIKFCVSRYLHSHPGINLRLKLRSSLRNKCHPLLLDQKINSQETILRNMYETFFWLAYKFYYYCREFPKGRQVQENPIFFKNVILALPSYFCSQAKRKFIKLTARQRCFEISHSVVSWVCCRAFVKCLKRKPLFKKVVKALGQHVRRLWARDANLSLLFGSYPLGGCCFD